MLACLACHSRSFPFCVTRTEPLWYTTSSCARTRIRNPLRQRCVYIPCTLSPLRAWCAVHACMMLVNNSLGSHVLSDACVQETLEFHVGNRVFDARPLFSQGSSAADRNKLERFFHMGGWGVASAFAPITYSPMPVLVYKRVPIEGVPMPEPSELYPAPDRVCYAAAARTRLVLVATGTVLHTDPTRIILKRIVLSGYPLSVRVRARTHALSFCPPRASTCLHACVSMRYTMCADQAPPCCGKVHVLQSH